MALKVFLPEFSRDDDEVQRFLRAMKTTLPLRHPHLVSMFGAGKSSSLCWVSMELIEGTSLAQSVQQAAAGSGDWRVALRAVQHVARALAFLHGTHIYHRNITPTNLLLLAKNGTVKLGDLMKAKAQEGRLARQVTQAGEILGDMSFLSPEQTTNASAGDGRADLYSLGAVAYALLVGRPPLEGKNFVETILKIRQTPPAPPPVSARHPATGGCAGDETAGQTAGGSFPVGGRAAQSSQGHRAGWGLRRNMDPDIRELIQQIHAVPRKSALVITGGGVSAAGWLLAVPGGSRTILEVAVPYASEALADYLARAALLLFRVGYSRPGSASP